METVKTPQMKTVEEVAKFLKARPSQLIKTLIYEADGKAVAALVRGDHLLNEVKLQRLLGVQSLAMAEPATIQKITGAPVGFSGPVGLKGIEIICDLHVVDIVDGITGANAPDAHFTHVAHGRDYNANRVADLKLADEGDICGTCKKGKLAIRHGIEVGHIFKLGMRYSAAMKAEFVDEDGSAKPFIMGCYGIGVSRIVAAIIEQKNDKDGIIWPAGIAPFSVIVIPVNSDDPEQRKAGESLYETLTDAGIEAVLDDRSERAGVKFKDADLMGFPVQVVIGPKTLPKGEVEIKVRDGGERKVVPQGELLAVVREGLSGSLPAGRQGSRTAKV